MLLRVDVMDSRSTRSLRLDPLRLREHRRVIALVPGGRLLDERHRQRAGGRACADAVVRAL